MPTEIICFSVFHVSKKKEGVMECNSAPANPAVCQKLIVKHMHQESVALFESTILIPSVLKNELEKCIVI